MRGVAPADALLLAANREAHRRLLRFLLVARDRGREPVTTAVWRVNCCRGLTFWTTLASAGVGYGRRLVLASCSSILCSARANSSSSWICCLFAAASIRARALKSGSLAGQGGNDEAAAVAHGAGTGAGRKKAGRPTPDDAAALASCGTTSTGTATASTFL